SRKPGSRRGNPPCPLSATASRKRTEVFSSASQEVTPPWPPPNPHGSKCSMRIARWKNFTNKSGKSANWYYRSVSSSRERKNSANRKISIAIMGCNNRGMDHISGYLAQADCEIAWICDVDSRVVEKGIAAVEKKTGRKPKGAKDIRKVLEDNSLDAVSIAAPDHWHTPATILACQASKHVYIEKPGSHNAHESEKIVTV